MTVNTNNFDVNNWGEFVHKKALNDVIQQINQVDAEQNNAISKISDLANQANQNAVNAGKLANMAMQSATNAKNTATQAENTATQAENTATQAENTANALKNDVDNLKNNAMMKDANAYSDFANVSATQVNGEAVQNFTGYYNHYKIYNVNGEEFERVEFSIGGAYTGDLTQSDVIQITLNDELITETEWDDGHLLITGQSGQVLEVTGAQVNSDGIRINFNNYKNLINKLTGPYQISVWCYQTKKITE